MPAMEHDDLPRRALLQLIASAFGAAALSWDWGAIAEAAHQAHATPPRPAMGRLRSSPRPKPQTSKPSPRRSSRPTTRPGAREAGVVLLHRPGARDVLLAPRRRLSRAARRVPGGVSRTASGRRLVRVAHVRAADRVSEDGRAHAVLPHDATAHAARHVLDARLRRQSRRRRLEAHRVRGRPCLSAAVRLLRSRLSRLRHRPGERK